MARREFLIDIERWLPHEKAIGRFWAAGKNAKRFFVPKETVGWLNTLKSEDRSLMRSMRRFAKPPFDPIYLEFQNEGLVVDGYADDFGVLISGDWFSVCATGDERTSISLIPALMRVSDHRYEARHNVTPGGRNIDHEELAPLMRSCLDFCEIMFLLMHQPKAINRVDVPHERGVAKGKLRTWRAHSVLTINIGEANPRRIFNTGTRTGACREHEVRGHWVHYPESLRRNGCEHDWQRIEDTGRGGERWRCQSCNGLRVWRADFVRGDGKLGTKFHTYEVKRGRKNESVAPPLKSL